MPRRGVRFFILIALIGLGACLFLKRSPPGGDCVSLPVRFFPFADLPTIKVEIGNKNYSLLVDLGSSHPIDLAKKVMQKIKHKTPVAQSSYIGIRGTTYPTQGFRIPQVRVSNLTIDGVVGFEENLDFLRDAQTWESPGIWSWIKDLFECMTLDGRVGWPFFNGGVVLFDFPHSLLIVAKDLNSLQDPLHGFIQVPFSIEKWGIVLLIQTNLGVQKFLLDTGATCSLIRKNLLPETVLTGVQYSSKLIIGNQDFGPWLFRPFEYNPQMECDGILGIDFFKKHKICLDFQHKRAYVREKTQKCL